MYITFFDNIVVVIYKLDKIIIKEHCVQDDRCLQSKWR